MMGKYFFKTLIEIVAVHHDYIAAAQALNLDVGADPDHLKSFGMVGTRVGSFHLDLVV